MTKTRMGLVVLALAGLGWAVQAGGSGSRARAVVLGQSLTETEREQLLAKGKTIFVEKCGKCHNERGDKELSSGKPLGERRLGTDTIAKAVNGRLSKGTEEERRAVTLYIASLMNDPDKGAAKP